jgi:hypothetical protein
VQVAAIWLGGWPGVVVPHHKGYLWSLIYHFIFIFIFYFWFQCKRNIETK